MAPLLQASDGNFYGTTSRAGFADGRQVGGTVFQFTGTGNPVTMHAFDGNMEGPTPMTSLVEAPDGMLWGTTSILAAGTHGRGVWEILIN